MGAFLKKQWSSQAPRKREISSEELTLCCLSQIEKQEPKLARI